MSDVSTVITILDWDDSSRPEIRLERGNYCASVFMGGHWLCDIRSKDEEDYISQLKGWAEIFNDAAKEMEE